MCNDARAALTLPSFLALESRQIPIICAWLNVQSLGLIDIAVSSYSARKQWLIILQSITCHAINVWRHSHSSMRWIMMRNIRVIHIQMKLDNSDRISDLTFEPVDISGTPASYGDEVENDSILSKWEGRKHLQSIDLHNCKGITDMGLSALGHGCGQLQTIDLSQCQCITDMGLSALGHGCGQLQTISLSGCQGITDIGISALSHGCGQLQTISLNFCSGITDIGISAMKVICCVRL